ncbi:MAG: tetratricopeptide repeat protein [Gammaproteobacteria bacterium]|nr:tetratricopeptide repeat protein [Gammaproteobacteria bacterium]
MIFAEDRSCTTQFELGQMFRKTESRIKDHSQAAEWFTRSAQQGYRKAQYKIGLMYARGLGVKSDPVRAYAWLKVAATQGSRRAMVYLKKLAEKMSPYQLERAHILTKDYYRRFVVPYTT